ncbi:hypothetical protein F66182_5771 [Fusarium sp. NRRL 66182]|nr:hypothetical protein F66182_5771 [Fusarium sp. NRRL 66182]
MASSADAALTFSATTLCAALIFARCLYRVVYRCRIHQTCHRSWRIDDFYMTIAILPLVGRAACIVYSFALNPNHTYNPATQAEADAAGTSVAALDADRELSHKLLIPTRIFYALFLWCLKLGLLAFYERFIHVFRWGKLITHALWWFIVATFVAVFITILAECRPLSLMWALDYDENGTMPSQIPLDYLVYTDIAIAEAACQRAVGNLIFMAVCNIVINVALIILPFPILRHLPLDLKQKLQLGVLFSVGGVLVAVTVLRLPLILNESVSQKSRSMARHPSVPPFHRILTLRQWASIEIMCACVVANTPFFYAIVKDLQRQHDDRPERAPSNPRSGDFYLQRLSSSGGPRAHEEASLDTSKGVVRCHEDV